MARNRDSRFESFFELFAVRRIVRSALPRANLLHAMIAPLQSLDDASQGHGYTVYFGWIGLRDHHHPER